MITFIILSIFVAAVLSALVGVVMMFIKITWPLFLILVCMFLVLGLISYIFK